MTEPGGNVARSRAASPLSGASRARTSETRCQTPECGWASGRSGASTLPYSATRPRSLRIRSTIITCSARSFSERSSAAGSPVARRRALDRTGRHDAPAAAQEQLRRQAGDPAPRREEAGAVRGLQPRHRVGEEGGDVAVEGRVEAQAEVGLEDLPGRDPLDAVPDRGDVAGAAGRVEGERGGFRRDRLGRGGEQAAQVLEAGALFPQGLEPPLPLRVHPQDVVVEGEVGGRERVRARRRRRQVFDERPEAVAEPAEPAAADDRRRRARPPAGPPGARTGRRPARAGCAARRRRSRRRPPSGRSGRTRQGSSRSASRTRSGGRVQSSSTIRRSSAWQNEEGLRRRPDVRGLSSMSRRRVRSPTPPVRARPGTAGAESDAVENCASRCESHEITFGHARNVCRDHAIVAAPDRRGGRLARPRARDRERDRAGGHARRLRHARVPDGGQVGSRASNCVPEAPMAPRRASRSTSTRRTPSASPTSSPSPGASWRRCAEAAAPSRSTSGPSTSTSPSRIARSPTAARRGREPRGAVPLRRAVERRPNPRRSGTRSASRRRGAVDGRGRRARFFRAATRCDERIATGYRDFAEYEAPSGRAVRRAGAGVAETTRLLRWLDGLPDRQAPAEPPVRRLPAAGRERRAAGRSSARRWASAAARSRR